ncbi:cytosolic Fe-S cluster assembly factor Nubp2 homolog [Planococcus citri]|uniref:cytosolic Fe-S cluster assembly factor Nubp2 homolog n=1 Tax=Planococcus citri TaxID=170843 RepID=UPI0031F77B5A
MTIKDVKHIILILSGKGGVGKSTVSVQLSLSLKEKGFKVGLLDIDLCGPSIPHLLNLEDKDIHQSSEGWIPVYTDQDQNLAVMSIGFLLKSRNDSVAWRGPKKTATINQFLTDVNWQNLDYLIIDTPPGTSDEHITVIEKMRELNCDGAILVTTPQEVAIEDVRKEYTLCKKTGIPVIGIIENMSGYVCNNCHECTNIFSSEGGKLFAEFVSVPFLGRIPIDLRLGNRTNSIRSISAEFPDSQSAKTFQNIIEIITKV